MAGLLAPQIKFRYTDANGNPLSAGKVYTYVSGTNTLQLTYTDSALSVPNTNPIILNAAGEADIYLQGGKVYRFTIKDANDVLINTTDGIAGGSPAAGGTWQNVQSYGAAGDGVTDDTAAIQSAVNYVLANGGTLYFPEGRYKLTDQLNINKAITVVGDGVSSVLYQSNVNKNLWNATADVSYSNFSKMKWEGVGYGTGAGTSMGFSGWTAGANVLIRFHDLNIVYFALAGIYLPDSFCCTIDSCLIRYIGKVGTIAAGNALACSDSYGGGIRYGKITFTGSACTGNSTHSTYIANCGRGVYVDGNERVVSHGFLNTKVELCYIGIDIDGRNSSTTLSRSNWLGADTYFEANKYVGCTMGEGVVVDPYRNDTTPGTGLPGSTSKDGRDGVQFTGRYIEMYDSKFEVGNNLATAWPVAFAIDKGTTTNYVSTLRVNNLGGLTLTEGATALATEQVSLYSGSGNPEASIPAQTGSLYMRHNGSDMGNTLYIKITGDNTNTGWRPVGPVQGPTAARPTADLVNKGLLYYDTDIARTVVSNGAGVWREYNGLTSVTGTLAAVPTHKEGAMYWATDTDDMLVSDGSFWRNMYSIPEFVSLAAAGTLAIGARGGYVINTGTLIASATVTLPGSANAVSGDKVIFGTNGAITALTLNAGAGASVVGATTTMPANTSIEYVYNTSTTSWYKVR